ncbi:MAG TPA: ABC transporter substrate-binding protein, partial [Miltoncostaea sp.]|nr:ABC transporter substrate-binding protein [Miltoncostaea sp.]
MTRPRARRTVLSLAATACASAVVLAVSACGGGDTASNPAPTDGKLTVGLLGDIGQPPDPDIYYANNGTAIMINAYEGLVQYKDNVDAVEIAPRLATAWTVSPDKTVYTFTLRKGVTFHDGTPFTCAAIKPSFDRRIAVKGGAAYMVEGVKSVDCSTPGKAVITLDGPNSAFLDYLASPFGPKMESPTALKAHAGSDNAQTYLQSHDVGTGPYELASAETGTKYVLKQYPGYWGPKSPFTEVDLPVYNDASALQLAFDSGDVSTIVAALPSSSLGQYENSDAVSSYLLPTLQSALVTTNPNRDFFKTQEARQAFMQFLDREKLIPQVLGDRSELATSNYAKGMIPGGADKQDISYDPSVMTKYAATLP